VAEVQPSRGKRALVLGGGGVTGIAWEVGVLAALRASGVDLGTADPVIGSSAGAFVGAALASGYDLERLFAAQSEPNDTEPRVAATPQTWAAWAGAFAAGGDDPHKIGAALGEVSRATPAGMPLAERQAVVHARLVTTQWPHSLQVTAIDADTGQLHVFDAASGVSLLDAASASGAVPGIWPLVTFNGKSWLDGGMVSTTNARLAEGYERVVVLAPMPSALGAIPGAAQDLAVLSAHARTLLIAPDEASVAAIGPNPYDPDQRGPAAAAGRVQGTALAETVRAIW
jgi:NTE family protein